MKREILFKARRIDTGECVECDLIHGFGRKYGRMFILPLLTYIQKDVMSWMYGKLIRKQLVNL